MRSGQLRAGTRPATGTRRARAQRARAASSRDRRGLLLGPRDQPEERVRESARDGSDAAAAYALSVHLDAGPNLTSRTCEEQLLGVWELLDLDGPLHGRNAV